MPKTPTKQAMLDFLRAGIKMMKTEETRAALKDGALPHAGHKLIDLQRAGWAPLGYDADVGCKALDQIDCADAGNKELIQVRQEFMLTAMRTYLQAVKDRRPAVLENKEPMPRAKILEFFDVCNTKTLLCITSVRPNGVVEPDTAFKVGRMDLPETHKARGMDRC